MLLAVLLALMTAVVGKELVLFPRQDVYVEKQRPTWSYRTSVLQVGKTDSPSSEHRAFLRFDLSTVAASRARVVSAKLRLHPLLASPNARLTHHACLLTDVTWRSDEVSWEAQPDGQCRDRSAPCCGNAIGSWQPRPSQPSEVELTYYVKRAMGASADRLLALHLYAPTAASTREHYYVQYGSSRRADASTRPELVLDVIAPTSARESTVDGKGLYRALAGSPATFTISARDAEGLAQAAGGDDFHVGLVSSNGASLNASVADTGNGTYSVYYTPTVAGLYKLDVTLGGRAVGDAPFTTHIVPAPTAPAHCIATGAGLFEGVAGAASSFVITPRASFGNARPLESNDVFTVFVARLGAAAGHPHTGVPSAAVLKWQPAIVSDLRNGTYEAEYTVKEAGAYVVRVQLGGIHIMGSPFQATILPSRTNARASSATGGGLRKCTAGVPTSFSIVARDEFGNARSVCGDDFDVTLVGPETSTGSARVHGVVSESGNGTYVVEYTVTSAGLYYVSITLAGRHVKGSPYAMQALPAEARASHTSAFGEGLASTTAGNLTEIFILAKDTYGNAEHTSTGGNITVSLSGPEEITAKVVDSLTGVYTASYTPRKAGSYAVSILYNQLPIFGSPYTTVVRPGRAHALTSVIPCLGVQGTPASDDVVDGCAAAVGIAGEVNSFAVRARDSSGNDCVTGGELVEAVLLQAPAASNTPNMRAFIEGTRGAGLKATVLDTTDGAYSITYRTLAAGAYQLSITIEGAHIRGSPFQVVVKPGATCADKSMVEGGGRSSATAGETTPLLIRAVDCYGNTQTEGGDPFSVTLMRPGVSPLMADVLDLSDGRYSVSYNATISGLWQLHVTTNGVHAIGSPFHVLVEPGPTSAHATIAVGEGTQRAPIGEPTSVIVRTKDMLGNDRAIGGDRISATLTQAATSSVVHASVRDTRDGSYTLTYTLTLTSWQTDYLLVVKVNNESIGGSPYRVKPVPGPTVCDQSISISEPTCIAGAVSEAPIFAKDRLGNQRSSGGDVFTASLELLEAPYNNESVQVGDNGDGSYKAMWVVTRAAHHKLWIAGRCGPIKGSPYSVHCKPGALSVSHSQLYGAAATDAIAGAKSVFYVRARDVFDNTLLEGSYRWGASLTASAGSWTVEQALVHGRHELERGSFGLHYNVTKAGTYELVVGALGVDGRVNASMQVQGSPTVVTVRAGPLCGRRSKVFGPTAANGAAEGSPEGDASPDGAWVEGAGRPVRLWIEARDAHDNPHESAIEPAPFRIVVRRKGGGRLATPAALVKAASKGGVGAYTADLVLPKTGSYLVDVVAEPSRTLVGAEGGELRGSPYPLRIVPGPTSAFQSTADGGGLSSFTARVGALQWVLITARDMYGNARSHGGDRFSLILSGPNGTRLTASSMVDYANGTYVGSYLATVAGNYSISVQRADEAGVWWDIKGSPFSVSIASGPTNPFVSRLVGAHEVSAGEQTAFNLMSRDEFGNAPVGGERHRFSVSAVPRSTGVPLPIAQLLDAGRGNYTVLHVFSQAGEYVVRTALLGQGGGTLPDFPLRVSPGALSPSHCELLWPCHAPKCVEAASRRQGYFVGWPVRFSVLPFDAYGNRRPDAGRTATFVARVHGPRAAAAYSQLRCAGASAVPNDDGTSALHCRAEQRADGLYVVEFVPLVRGEFVVNVSVYAGAYGSRKLGNLPGKMVVQVDAAPVATCARFRNCTDHGVCNFLTGRCVCDAGWDGDDCSHGASIRRSCPSDCSNHGYCSDETDAWGRNVCRCAVDYAGADCATWVSKIVVPEVTGPECPNECSGHGACNATCGECACEPGWRGDDCSVSGEHFITALAKDALGRQLVLDFSPSTRRFGVYAVHKGLSDEGRLECAGLDAKPLCSGTWPVVLDAASSGSWARPFLFTSLGNGMLLQYEPTHGAYLLLGCDGSCEGGLPCSRRLAAGRCSDAQLPLGPSMRASYIGLDSLLFHNGATGAYTVHRIARSFLEQSSSGCLFDPPIAASTWPEVGIHRHTWLGVHDLLVDYEPARGNYTVWRFDRAAQGDDRVSLGVVTRGHLMATSRQFVALGDGQLLLAADGAAHSASTVAGELPSAGGDAYEMWACSTSDDAYSPSDALPCLPIGHADGLGRPHACPLGCAAGDCACASKASCLAQAGCGWCADTGAGVCTAGDAGGPAAAVGGGSECFAWSYTTERTVAGASAYEPHSYAYVEGAMLLDYSAADGKYKLWNVANPPRPGCPGVQWPPTASGTLAVTRHSLAAVPLGTERAFGLVDYEPKSGDFRLGSCNRSATVSAGHLDCRTSTNGTWHTGGFQLLWVGGKTVMRYSKATGQYTLWTYTTAQSAHAFEATPAADGALLRADGQRLVGASLTYLDAGELLATVPSSGLVALYRRSSVPTTLSAASWSLQPEEGVVMTDGFEHRWESQTVLRGWQFAYVGRQMLMMLKPSSGAYRLLNCSAVYTSSSTLPRAAVAAGLAGGPPCPLVVEGSLPHKAPCEHSREQCLLAPQCGWCQSTDKCVSANEDGVCSGHCPDGQLLYSTAPSSYASQQGASRAEYGAECSAQLACDRCTEQPSCAWCTAAGGQCIRSIDGKMGECRTGKLVAHDSSKCPLVEEADFTGLVGQVE